MKIIDKAIQFVIEHCKDQTIGFERNLPWRNDGLHILQHGLRVKAIAEQLMVAEGIKKEDEHYLLVQVASILHDLGSYISRDDHASMSVDLSLDFLKEHFSDEARLKIQSWIGGHSDKSAVEDSLELTIIKDADVIDEYGVQSLIMSSEWVSKESAFYFRELEDRLISKEVPFGKSLLSLVKTQSAKNMVKKKMAFMNDVIKHLSLENSGSLTYESYQKYLD